MTSFSDANGRKVVDRSTAETVGRINDFVLDAPNRRVAALVLKKTTGSGDTLPWSDISAFGDDAVVVTDGSVVVARSDELAELANKRHAAHNKRILDTAGVELGAVRDIEFDPETGALLQLVTKDGAIAADALLAVGSYAVVVRATDAAAPS